MSRRHTRKKIVQEVIHPNAAGIDIGSERNYVSVPPDRDETPVQSFGCFTEDLHSIAKWLQACEIDTVAMEATGVYWIPLCQILESYGFEVCLVNAKHVKNVPGRKTDVVDCQWLQQLHAFGLLAASFRPDDDICVLRSYWRHREGLIQNAASHIHRMQKALDQMNIQLHKVISDITGVTGLRIIDAILNGERDRKKLAALKDPRIRSSSDEIVKALEGDYRKEHLFTLRQALETYRFCQEQIAQCDREIENHLNGMDTHDGPTQGTQATRSYRRKAGSNQPEFDLRSHLIRITGTDFTEIDGLEVLTAQTVIAEVGLDPSKFPSAKRFASWLGLCPNNRITGGEVKGRASRKVKNRAANAFRLAAQALSRSDTPLGTHYRRMRTRLGPAGANTATAHKLARIFYSMWTNPAPYDPTKLDQYEQQRHQRNIEYIEKRALKLGFILQPAIPGP